MTICRKYRPDTVNGKYQKNQALLLEYKNKCKACFDNQILTWTAKYAKPVYNFWPNFDLQCYSINTNSP